MSDLNISHKNVLKKPLLHKCFVILKDHGSTSLARARLPCFSMTRFYYMNSLIHLGGQNSNAVGLEHACMCTEGSAKYLGCFNPDL